MLGYKSNHQDVESRLRTLYGRLADDRIFATMAVPSSALRRFAGSYQHAQCPYPDVAKRTRFWDDLFGERITLEDDSLPAPT